MTLKVEIDSSIIKLNGVFAVESIQLIDEILKAYLKTNTRLIIDLSSLSKIDVECVFFLEKFIKKQDKKNKSITIRRVNNNRILKAFKVLKLETLFEDC
ncbi:STAS domain-containing protein [Leeuwenhoekiella sp. W20_SRS_FM14]|uniref:STAS domain-containing protein n=1 Tax=Leeuwenhoekiella sp. W20_SRS_FM14 TaxID=3240270 RepID=UPI003F99BFBC